MKTAIICVAYNRWDSLKRLLLSLEQATYPEQVTLIISIDKSNTDMVERMADSYHWPHGELRIAKHEKNLGLRAHMLSLGKYFNEFDALAVLEDDVTVTTSFYYYTQACVNKYYGDSRIAGISLYGFSVNYQTLLPFAPAKTAYDAYFMNCAQSWGEVWMKPQWEQFIHWYEEHSAEFNLDYLPKSLNQWPKSSWLKYHTRYCIEQNLFFVYPYYSLSTNNADPGVNQQGKVETLFQAHLQTTLQKDYRLPDVAAEDAAFYDGFFQRKYLGKLLELDDEELCVDLFSDKPASLYKHYLLSNKCLPYKVIKSFALQLRPIELNIICQREGNELWLYDTTKTDSPPRTPDRYLAYTYFFQKGFYKVRTMIGASRALTVFMEMIKNKLGH